jgi:hypothetical protein
MRPGGHPQRRIVDTLIVSNVAFHNHPANFSETFLIPRRKQFLIFFSKVETFSREAALTPHSASKFRERSGPTA